MLIVARVCAGNCLTPPLSRVSGYFLQEVLFGFFITTAVSADGGHGDGWCGAVSSGSGWGDEV
jgi:hypothetical protein